jgi:hypothetical protein
MSHGPSSEGSSAEPNLTPLLDVVLQLLMFFVLCANFKQNLGNNPIVDLAWSDSAVFAKDEEAKAKDRETIYVNLRKYNPKDYPDMSADDRREAENFFRDKGPRPTDEDELKKWLNTEPKLPVDENALNKPNELANTKFSTQAPAIWCPSYALDTRVRRPITMEQFKAYLKQMKEWNNSRNADRAAEAKKQGLTPPTPVELVVNIRAEEGLHWEHYFRVREICSELNIPVTNSLYKQIIDKKDK